MEPTGKLREVNAVFLVCLLQDDDMKKEKSVVRFARKRGRQVQGKRDLTGFFACRREGSSSSCGMGKAAAVEYTHKDTCRLTAPPFPPVTEGSRYHTIHA